MTEATRKKLIIATLPVALIWAGYNLTSSPKTSTEPGEQYATVQPLVQTENTTGASQFIDVEAELQKGWGDDPFRRGQSPRPTTVHNQSGLSLILSGIIYSQTRPLAFINKRTVAIGDKVGEATVVAIDHTTVTLEHQGRTITLKVNKS